MKYLTTVAALTALLAATSANATNKSQSPVYLSISGDLTWVNDSSVHGGRGGTASYDVGGGGTVAVGYDNLSTYNSYTTLRGEIEAGYHSAEGDNIGSTLRIWTLMANAYYDMPNASQFTPYIGVGIGDAELSLSRDSGLRNSDGDDNEFAYQAMLGVSYTPETTPAVDWSLGYHYLGVYKPDFGSVKLDSLNTNSVELGLRYHF